MPFREIAGHTQLLELLARAAHRGSLPPSLVFAGPDGVGKRLAAVALAQILNCQAPRSQDPPDACGECASCRRIARGVHADVLILQPGENGSIKIETVRDAIERAAYRPFEGRRRVLVIDQAHELTIDAQNALLKTLEEPPPSSVFILVTSRPDMLLITVRSRCQRLRFGRLAPGDVADVLTMRHGYAAVEAHAAAAAADGSIGAALESQAEEAAAARDAAGQLLEEVARTTDPRRRLESAKLHLGTGKKAVARPEVARRLLTLSSILRDIGVLQAGGDERALANADMKPLLTGLQRSFDPDRTLAAFAAVDRALDALDRNANAKLVADWIALKL